MSESLTTALPPFTNQHQEQSFLAWFRRWATQLRLNMNPDDPRHFYDYRRAWLSHVEPTYSSEYKQYHWPSEYKLPGHAHTFVGGIDTRNMEPIPRVIHPEK